MAGGLLRARLVDEMADQAPERSAVGVALPEVKRSWACAAAPHQKSMNNSASDMKAQCRVLLALLGKCIGM